jgi:hypothetical protein
MRHTKFTKITKSKVGGCLARRSKQQSPKHRTDSFLCLLRQDAIPHAFPKLPDAPLTCHFPAASSASSSASARSAMEGAGARRMRRQCPTRRSACEAVGEWVISSKSSISRSSSGATACLLHLVGGQVGGHVLRWRARRSHVFVGLLHLRMYGEIKTIWPDSKGGRALAAPRLVSGPACS